ncbi:MAG: YkgJ family cysteine cluster protein, partial [Chrysiogenales bacterium]
MSDDKKPFSPPCEECGGRCCRYIAIGMDRPTTKTEYDHIRWYLSHDDVHVFIDHDRGWYV